MRTFRRTTWLVACAALSASLASAQGSGQIAASADAEMMEVDPIACWWRTDKASVYVGEPLTVVLTCSVLDEPSVSVLVDESGLDPSVMQLPPFEVLGGTHAVDLHTADRRFFQYEYRMRFINESEFGNDVPLPMLALSYRVRNVADGAATDTRERGYELPFLLIRMQSLVPEAADDIRDGSMETFADLDARTFRANAFVVSGGVLFTLAAAFVVLAGVRVVRSGRGTAKAADRLVPDWKVLGGVGRELAEIRRAREAGGWTSDLAGRALSALRIAANYALDQRASQAPRAPGAATYGTLVFTTGLAARRPVLVSGSATAETLGYAIEHHSPAAQHRLDVLEGLQTALASLTAVRFGRDTGLNNAALDEALESGSAAVAQLRKEHTVVARAIAAVKSRTHTEAWS